MVVYYNMDNIDMLQMQSLFWEALSLKWKQSGSYPVNSTYSVDFNSICISIFELAQAKKLVVPPQSANGYIERQFSPATLQRIGSILWGLVSQQILYVGFVTERIGTAGYAQKPYFDITEYGIKVLEKGKPIPHDPEGYLQLLQRVVPNIDNVVFTYATESVKAYNANLLLSATTAIGCASEKALLLLIEAYIKFLPNDNERTRFETKTKGNFIKRQFEEFQKSLAGQYGRIDKTLLDGIDIVINGIFELLRQNRNDAGHPTGKEMDKETVYALLQVFITYLKRIYALIEFFQCNSVV